MTQPRRTTDRGFTLIEVLISIAITGIIVGVLASALDVSFRNNDSITSRLNGANDALSLTNLFPTDIAATPPGGREIGPSLISECGSGLDDGFNVIRLTWSETATGPETQYRVAYRLVPQPDGNSELRRVECTWTAATGFVNGSSRRVADDLLPIPAGWDSTQAPARLIYTTLDDPNIALELTTSGEAGTTFVVGGNRVNPGTSLPPPPGFPVLPDIRTQVTTSASAYISVGDTLPFTATVLNVGTTRLDAIAVSDPQASTAVTCDRTSIAPGLRALCTYTHVVTQSDLDNGSVQAVATGSGTPPGGGAMSAVSTPRSVQATQTPQMTVTKCVGTGPCPPTPVNTTYTAAGEVLPFHVEVTNTGNVTLHGLVLDDPKANAASIGNCTRASLAPGATFSCDFDYTVSTVDLGAGKTISSVTTATATVPLPTARSITATSGSTTVTLQANPTMTAEIRSAPTPGAYAGEGAVITYVVTVTNTGNVELNGVAITDPTDDDGVIPCAPTSLGIGGVTTCTVVHTVTAAEAAAQATITSQATATASPASGGSPITAVANTVSVGFQASNALTISMAVTSPNPAEFGAVGEQIVYGFTVTNTGTSTVTAVQVDDPLFGQPGAVEDCGTRLDTLGPGQTNTCQLTKTVQAGDLGADIVNSATVAAMSPIGRLTGASNSVTVTYVGNPLLTVDLAASPSPTFTTLHQVITYTATVTNSGGVAMTGVHISAQTVGGPWSCDRTTLSVGQTARCTGSYTTTDEDAVGSVTNVVTAQGTYGVVTPQTYSATSPSVTVSSSVNCAVLGVGASPNPTGESGGRLVSPISISAPVAGTCSGLRVRYFPQNSAAVVADLVPGPGSWTYVIPTTGAGSSIWDPGARDVSVIDAADTVLATTTLTVFGG